MDRAGSRARGGGEEAEIHREEEKWRGRSALDGCAA